MLASIRKNKIARKGPITTPIGSGFGSVNVALRQALDLYALVCPIKPYKTESAARARGPKCEPPGRRGACRESSELMWPPACGGRAEYVVRT